MIDRVLHVVEPQPGVPILVQPLLTQDVKVPRVLPTEILGVVDPVQGLGLQERRVEAAGRVLQHLRRIDADEVDVEGVVAAGVSGQPSCADFQVRVGRHDLVLKDVCVECWQIDLKTGDSDDWPSPVITPPITSTYSPPINGGGMASLRLTPASLYASGDKNAWLTNDGLSLASCVGGARSAGRTARTIVRA